MKSKKLWGCSVSLAMITGTGLASAAAPVGTGFIYQGQLQRNGVTIDGTADMNFRLWDAELGGTQLDSVGVADVAVVNGLFTARVDFGTTAFDGNARWLEVEVEFPTGAGNWTTLSPRQPITPAPYALHALNAGDDSAWQTAGANLYYDAGYVGIGTNVPAYPLHVVGQGARVARVEHTAAAGSATALHARSASTSGRGVLAEATAGSGFTNGVEAYAASPNGRAVYAFNEAETGDAYAVYGENISPSGIAVFGLASNSKEDTQGVGVYGRTESDHFAAGVYGEATAGPGSVAYGVRGVSASSAGVRGENNTSGNSGMLGTATAGAYGGTSATTGIGVSAVAASPGGTTYAVKAESHSPSGYGVYASNDAGSGAAIAVYGLTASPTGYAAYLAGGRNYFEGNVGIGTADPGRALDVNGQIRLRSGPSVANAGIWFTDASDVEEWFVGKTNIDGKNQLGFHKDAWRMVIEDGGNLGLGTTAPADRLHVAGGDVRIEGDLRLYDGAGHAGIMLRPDNAAGIAGEISLFNDAGLETVELIAAEGAANGGQIVLRDSDGTQTIQFDAEYGDGGGAYVELAGGAGDPTLRLDGAGAGRNDATLRVNNSRADQGMAAFFTNSSTFATMHIQNDGTGETLWLENTGGGDLIVARTPERWEFWVDEEGVTNTRVVRIHGGADLSEGFDVRCLSEDRGSPEKQPDRFAPEPGMVVSIDPQNPGKLVVSTERYDRKVAGIISGAGGVNPGMIMGQTDSGADGEYPVALTGRVYCQCIATNGPIAAGDFLTTSDAPGHAMKVLDHRMAQGAIIGKAMTSLPEGRGLVLVLVSLQ